MTREEELSRNINTLNESMRHLWVSLADPREAAIETEDEWRRRLDVWAAIVKTGGELRPLLRERDELRMKREKS